jgi:hypothetical protein
LVVVVGSLPQADGDLTKEQRVALKVAEEA